MAPQWCHSDAMDLSTYIDSLRRELVVAAAAGGDDATALAERLTAPLESATRLALLNALSAAADEITTELAPGSVSVRLRGVDPEFVVTAPPSDRSYDDAELSIPAPSPPSDADEGSTSRINLRLPESIKARVEDAAGKEGLSLNAWLVRSVAATLDSSGQRARRRAPRDGAGFTGWVR